MDVIVVGIDGSAGAQAALEFALEEAALRGASLRIVCAWEAPYMLNPPGTLPAELVCNFEKEAKVIVDKALRRATQLGPCVSCDAKILEGQPADVLLKQSHNATLVVVGSRGRGEFASLLFGSVSQEVTRHAKCPVVVVPASSG